MKCSELSDSFDAIQSICEEVEKVKGDEPCIAMHLKTMVLLSEFITHFKHISEAREAFIIRYKDFSMQVYPYSGAPYGTFYVGKRSEVLKLIGYEDRSTD